MGSCCAAGPPAAVEGDVVVEGGRVRGAASSRGSKPADIMSSPDRRCMIVVLSQLSLCDARRLTQVSRYPLSVCFRVAVKVCTKEARIASSIHRVMADFQARIHAGPSAAERLLEGSDDLLQRVAESLPLGDKLRLQIVSKRWQRILMAHLCFSAVDIWRAVRIITVYGATLRHLDVSTLNDAAARQSSALALVQSLIGGASPELQVLIMWWDCDLGDSWRIALTEAKASQLSAACPKLGADTRLMMQARGAVEALRILDALPGVTALLLLPPADCCSGLLPEGQSNARRAVSDCPKGSVYLPEGQCVTARWAVVDCPKGSVNCPKGTS